MKLVKIVKLQRVRYGDLGEGDRYHAEWAHTANKGSDKHKWMLCIPEHEEVKALDTNKYPPEVTYNIEGIPDDDPVIDGGYFFPDYQFLLDEDEIETRMI